METSKRSHLGRPWRVGLSAGMSQEKKNRRHNATAPRKVYILMAWVVVRMEEGEAVELLGIVALEVDMAAIEGDL